MARVVFNRKIMIYGDRDLCNKEEREREKAINNNTESERRTTTRKELKREGEKEIESERD